MNKAIQILDEMMSNPFNNFGWNYEWLKLLQEAKERINKETWWISVEEKEPEKFTDVLLFPWIEIWYMSNNWFWIYNNWDYTDWWYGNDYKAEWITHWMPLPLPPHE